MRARTRGQRWGQAALQPQAGTDGPKPKWAHGWGSQEGLLRALALVILVYSPTEPPWGLRKCPSLPPSLLRAWPAGRGTELGMLGEGSGGPDPAAPEAPVEPEDLRWVMLEAIG